MKFSKKNKRIQPCFVIRLPEKNRRIFDMEIARSNLGCPIVRSAEGYFAKLTYSLQENRRFAFSFHSHPARPERRYQLFSGGHQRNGIERLPSGGWGWKRNKGHSGSGRVRNYRN